MFGVYLLHQYPIDSRIFAPYLDVAYYGAEYHPKRKKLKGYQKNRK
jgi:hypothetical protein